MQDVSKKPDMVSISIGRETMDALNSVKYSGQSYDSIIRELFYTSGYDGWALKALFSNTRAVKEYTNDCSERGANG